MSEQLRSIYARWERLEDEKRAVSEDLKELWQEAKSNGYDTKALRAAFRQRAMSPDEASALDDHAVLVAVYLTSLVGPIDAPRAHPRIAREEPRQRANVLPQHEAGPSVATDAGQATVRNVGVTAGETAPIPIRPEPDDDIGIPAFLRREPTEREDAAVAAMTARRA